MGHSCWFCVLRIVWQSSTPDTQKEMFGKAALRTHKKCLAKQRSEHTKKCLRLRAHSESLTAKVARYVVVETCRIFSNIYCLRLQPLRWIWRHRLLPQRNVAKRLAQNCIIVYLQYYASFREGEWERGGRTPHILDMRSSKRQHVIRYRLGAWETHKLRAIYDAG